MSIIEFLWTISSCLMIALLSYLLYVTIRNDLRNEHERKASRKPCWKEQPPISRHKK